VGALATFVLLAGTCGIAGFILVSSMISDIVEEVQTATGRRSEGLLFTADSLPAKLIASLSAILPGLLLGWVAFPQQATPGPETLAIMTRVAWLYLPCIVLINVCSIGIWSFYRIDEESHARNLRHAARATARSDLPPDRA
jgi:Na+/melibiose symporter-like transporter